ncbi:MAG: chorismate mutase [Cellulosilyticum sp.]|nr:chorismate mutase [Cellulosilyticum sp.]
MYAVSIRGAITVEENSKEAILEATELMLQEILKVNQIDQKNIIQMHFSATKDLDAVYPAVAARSLGITSASLMCFQEMYVVGSLEKCIRVDVLVEQEGLTRDNVKHQYLREAKRLRPDLVKE